MAGGVRVKAGVVLPQSLLAHLYPQDGNCLVRILLAMEAVVSFVKPDYPIVITSVCDGEHSEGSCHYKARAIDFRTRGLNVKERAGMCSMLEERLGQDYDVVDEGDHLHIEYDPKG